MKTNNKKIALVTGGSKRIGASICEELHKSNINVMIHYKNSKEDALYYIANLEDQGVFNLEMVEYFPDANRIGRNPDLH